MAEIKELLLIDGVLYEEKSYPINECHNCATECDYKHEGCGTECPVPDANSYLKKSPLQLVDLRKELIKFIEHIKSIKSSIVPIAYIDEKFIDEYLTNKI